MQRQKMNGSLSIVMGLLLSVFKSHWVKLCVQFCKVSVKC